jgi:hypothetical protein
MNEQASNDYKVEFMTEDEQGDDEESIDHWIADLRSMPPVPWELEAEIELRAWREQMRKFNIEAVRKQFEDSIS